MQTELYSDGIGEITINGSVVRVEFVSLSATERDASINPKWVFRQRMIFSVEAFANSVEITQQALRGLIEADVVTRTQRAQASTTPVDSATGKPARQTERSTGPAPNGSPNFD
jgi:hypothetical protein